MSLAASSTRSVCAAQRGPAAPAAALRAPRAHLPLAPRQSCRQQRPAVLAAASSSSAAAAAANVAADLGVLRQACKTKVRLRCRAAPACHCGLALLLAAAACMLSRESAAACCHPVLCHVGRAA